MRSEGVDLSVYVVLDPSELPPDWGLFEAAKAAIDGGATAVQLRDKESSGRRLVRRSQKLQSICEERNATFVVNDRLDVALVVDADGVHLGPDDVPVEDARRIAPDLLIGASAGTPKRAAACETAGADYLGVGAIFAARQVKPDASEAKGPEVVDRVTDRVDVPVVGIGGITPERAEPVVEAGADGVAVVRAILDQDDPRSAARRLRRRVDAAGG